MQKKRSPELQGIEVRHANACRDPQGRCDCEPSYRPYIYDARTRRPLRGRWTASKAEARAWRIHALSAQQNGTLAATDAPTIREAGEALIAGMRSGQVRNRSGRTYKPSVIRGYESSLKRFVYPEIGPVKLSDIRRRHIQALADRLLLDHDPSTVRNILMPMRVIFRRALTREIVHVNPAVALELPAVEGRRERMASVEEATTLIAALPKADQAFWATAIYAGLRLGEIRALDWANVDLRVRVIHVSRSWDQNEGIVEPKSSAGSRRVPIPTILHGYLMEHQRVTGRTTGLIFGRSKTRPFNPSSVTCRADRIWLAAKLRRITPHECRHTYASFMIASGVNAKAICTYMGHRDISTTFNLYGHLMPGSEDQVAGLLDTYLAASSGSRPVQAVSAV